MLRTPRIIIIVCTLILAGTVAASAQSSTLEPTPEPTTPVPELVIEGDFHGVDLALGPDGHRHIVASGIAAADDIHTANDMPTSDLWYVNDRAGSWSAQRLLTGEGSGLGWAGASIAVDTDGSAHIAVVHDHVGSTPGATEGIYYLTDKDRQPGSFGTPTRVARADMTEPSLAVADGARYLAYSKMGRLGDPIPPAPVFFKTDLSGAWVSHRLADFGSGPALRVDSSGRAHIVYQAPTADGRRSILRYAQVDPATGVPSKSRRIPGTEDLWYSSALALESSGQPTVAWEASSGINWSKRTANGWSQPEKLDVRRSDALSLAVDSLDQSHVVFVGRGDAGRGVVHAQRAGATWPQSVIVRGVDWSSVASAVRGQDLFLVGTSGEWSSGKGPTGLWSSGPVPATDPAAMAAHEALAELLASVAGSDCVPFTESGPNDPFSYGAQAAIRCDGPAKRVEQLALFRFPDADSMAKYWRWRIARIDPPAPPREGACADGRRGLTRWDHGELACYVSPDSREAKLRWTDERTDTYGVIDARDRDLAGLHDAWLKLQGTGQAE